MRGRPDRTRFNGRTVISASQAITSSEMMDGLFPVDTGGINLKMQVPTYGLTGRELLISNTSDEWITASQEDSKFCGGLTQVAIGPYESVLMEYNKSEAAAGTHLMVHGIPMPSKRQSSTPTPSWTTHNATVTSSVMLYDLYEGVCFFEYHASGTDGKDATQVAIPLPYTPQYIQAKVFASGVKKIDTTVTDCVPYVAADQSTAANRVLTMGVPATFTDTKAWEIHIRGWYPVYGFTSFDSDPTWASGTEPASLTEVAVYKEVDGLVFDCGMHSSADNNAATGVTLKTPMNVVPNTGSYIQVASGILSNATWSNGLAYLDAANATEASRQIGFSKWPTMTDGQAIAVGWAAVYPMSGGIDFNSRVLNSWTTHTPASATVKAHYAMIGREYCWFEAYLYSADNNATTGVILNPPMVPMLADEDVRLSCYSLSNTTATMPQAKLLASETNPEDRLIQLDAFPSCTDGQALGIRVSGMFRVAG